MDLRPQTSHPEDSRQPQIQLFCLDVWPSMITFQIFEAGKGYPIVYVNSAFCELTGYGPHEVMGKSPSFLQEPKTDERVIQQLNADIKAGKLFHGKAINYRRDGSEFMVEWKIVPIRNDKDQITHYLAIQRDVSDQSV
ncbi:MAG: PAS domain-containing protein [Desulfobacterales bacterium]|jgi:PAS domain S-box-containing protein